MIGALDSLVNRQLADQLLAVAREALSNCARHAEARACLVEVEVDSDWLLLRVTDNGQGVAEHVRESGLRNLRRRAEQLGGDMTLEGIEPHGTCLCWRVPTGACRQSARSGAGVGLRPAPAGPRRAAQVPGLGVTKSARIDSATQAIASTMK